MKNNIKILLLVLSALSLTGCYEDYVKDYEYSAAYIAYQYDLRSLVVGEGMTFDFGAVIAGVMEKPEDKNVRFVIDDELVNGDLSAFGGEAPFTAIDGMKGTAPVGVLSQRYVTEAVTAASLSSLEPMPASYYKVSGNGIITVGKGQHTGTVTFTADAAAMLADDHVGRDPFYAIGYRIVSADVDTVLLSKSFGVIALRCENTFFGNWYHGGKSVVTNASGEVSEESYPTKIPADDNTFEVYSLTTDTPYSVTVNFFHNTKGQSMTITLEDGQIKVSSADGRITDQGSSWNKSKLLQDRKLFLNYSYTSADGSVTEVRDTLTFRNRIRDGINEWQDENPEHYN